MSCYENQEEFHGLTFDEINAVLVHKWYLSQKEGRDVGLNRAKEDFFKNHAEGWRKRKIKEDLGEQKEEIVRHKWYLSQKLGHEVGMTEAAIDWVRCGYAEHWRNKTGPYKRKE